MERDRQVERQIQRQDRDKTREIREERGGLGMGEKQEERAEKGSPGHGLVLF